MNDISLYQFGDFTKDWKLVTVRYRKDSGEMRFVYANPVAWKALSKHQVPYPEGSVFAKAAFKTGEDPAFVSSVVPSGTRRFQLMVKNSKKYALTNGWGYGLYQSDGNLFEGDISNQTISCHACHKIVPERDFVFSEPIEVSPFAKPTALPNFTGNPGFKFVTYDLKSAGPRLKSLLNENKFINLLVIDGVLRSHFFEGTLDEITPLLIHKMEKNWSKKHFAVGFVSSDNETFKLVAPYQSSMKPLNCEGSEMAVQMWEYRSNSKAFHQQSLCYAKSLSPHQ